MRFVHVHLSRRVLALTCLLALPFIFLLEGLMYWGEQFWRRYGGWIAVMIGIVIILGFFGAWPAGSP